MRRILTRLFFGLMVGCIGILPFLSITPARAQSTSTGTIGGQVTDPQNAVVPKADVTLRDVATNTTRKSLTDDSGRYTFVNIPPGIYDIAVSRTGTTPIDACGLPPHPGDALPAAPRGSPRPAVRLAQGLVAGPRASSA